MITIFVFSQNLVLNSLESLLGNIHSDKCVFITTHSLFDEEQDLLKKRFGKSDFISFGDVLTDEENASCDTAAYKNTFTVQEYYNEIKRLKNKLIISKIRNLYPSFKGFLLSDDLGIYRSEWIRAGFHEQHLEYYYNHEAITPGAKIKQQLKEYGMVRAAYNAIRLLKRRRGNEGVTCDVYSGVWRGRKYIFLGRLDRISYRMDINWTLDEGEKDRISQCLFYSKEECTYLTTLHESTNNVVPDKQDYSVYYIQDGYLPPNYSSLYLKFKPENVKYYAWDTLGLQLFANQGIPAEIMPFRIHKYLPQSKFKKTVKTILVATSGPGDWTAQKNRADEDLLVKAFCSIAEKYPDIRIIYRCHPTWIHPEHNGVNSINRVAEIFKERKLMNITLSTNIPDNDTNNFRVSFPRQSLQSDLEKADIVFGEHSISLIDAAMQGIPFASVNLTERRNLFCGISDFGFPHCSCIDDIERILRDYGSKDFVDKYSEAIKKYNEMTDES